MTDTLCGKCRKPIGEDSHAMWAGEPVHTTCGRALSKRGYRVVFVD